MSLGTERFNRLHPCPICGGWEQQPRGQETRCFGYIDSTGEYARCTREELAGNLAQNPDSTYSHRLHGPCFCGQEHGAGPVVHHSNGTPNGEHRERKLRLERRFEIRDVLGDVVAYHDRLLTPEGEKTFHWRRPDFEKAGLHGLKVESLPLYGSEHLERFRDGRSVVLVEGEAAAQRLLDAGIPAVGTVTGAGRPGSPKRPSDEVLSCLKEFRPVLWPDNDPEGRDGHMVPIAQALHGMGIEVRWLDWPEAPNKGDAADFLANHDTEEAFVLLRTAKPWEPTASAPASPEPEPEQEPEVEVGTIETVTTVARSEPWPEALGEAAFHGLVGRLVGLIDPYVESNEASVLVQFLTAFGVAAGLHPHRMVGATRHAPVSYVGLVGATSMGRKGTAWDPVETLFRLAEPAFASRIMSGIGSGERLVWLVRDRTLDSKGAISDPGTPDRRLLLQEPELARLLAVVNREGSTLSAYLRSAYDGKPLVNEVKSQGSRSSLHHIGLIGHCTPEELRGLLTEEQVHNGLANRLTWVLARREKKLPEPPVFEGRDIDDAARELSEVLERARTVMRLEASAAARQLWSEWYLALPDETAGLSGAIGARGPAQVTRFSVIYALTDGSATVEREHMEAALAVWNYSLRCVHYIWGGGTGDVIADRIFEELGYGPLTMTEIYRGIFSGNVSGPVLERAVRMLENRGLVARERVSSPGRGRPALRVRRKT